MCAHCPHVYQSVYTVYFIRAFVPKIFWGQLEKKIQSKAIYIRRGWEGWGKEKWSLGSKIEPGGNLIRESLPWIPTAC